MSERLCLSCEEPIVNRAKEHVIPGWLLKVLNVEYEQLIQVIAAGSEEQISKERSFTFDSFQEGRVCEPCNGGWMSDLEGQAKPLLVPLMQGVIGLSSLSDSESFLVARWGAKTAIVLSNCIELGKPAPAGSLRYLKENGTVLPSGFGVFGSQQPERAGTRRFAYLQRNSWVNASIDGAPNREEEMIKGAFKVGFQLRCLSLLTVFLPFAESRFLIAAGLHVHPWPPAPMFAAYKTSLDVPEPYDSYSVLKVLTHALGAVHPPFSAQQ
jgi:hypothetical protein